MSAERQVEATPSSRRYARVQALAQGGMAVLELARTEAAHGFEKYVAIKRIAPKWADDPEFIEMFLAEARLAAVLDHPNVVRVHDLGHDDRGPFFVMDYIHGEDLSALRRTQEGALPVEHVLQIGMGAAAGLHHAHTRRDFDGTALNIIHRDVSPSNILVTYDGGVKLVDFGIAKVTRGDGTRPSIRKGKIGYMSPEQCKGARMDGRSDVFSLGIVLWELLAGARLFGGGDNEFAAMNRIVNHDAPPLREANPDVPPEVADVVHTALARNPDARFDDARAMERALEELAGGLATRPSSAGLAEYVTDLFGERPYPWESPRAAVSVVTGPIEATAGSVATRAVAVEVKPEARPQTPRWRTPLVLTTTLASAALAATAWFWLASRDPDPGSPNPGTTNVPANSRAQDPGSLDEDPGSLEKDPGSPENDPGSPEEDPGSLDAPPASAVEPAVAEPAVAEPAADPSASAQGSTPEPKPTPKPKAKRRPKKRSKPTEPTTPAPTFDPDGLGPIRKGLK